MEVIDWFGHVECSHLVCSNVFFFSTVNSKYWLDSYRKLFQGLNNSFPLSTNQDMKEFVFANLDFVKLVILLQAVGCYVPLF